MLIPDKLRIVGKNVNLGPLDPETRARFYAACQALAWTVAVVSAARTRAQQRYLYRGYKAGKPGFNLAANPDWQRPDGTYGSRHMIQPTGYSYALDLRTLASPWAHVHQVFRQFGLRFTVHGENWHCQALEKFKHGEPVYWPIEAQRQESIQEWRDRDKHAASQHSDGWADALAFVQAARKETLRRGAEGPVVRLLQKSINAAYTDVPGHELTLSRPLDTDGVFGGRTSLAVRAFQHDHHLRVDGVVGPQTWAALLD